MSALSMTGREGQLLIGTRILAELDSWDKRERRLTFHVKRLNVFLAGLDQPPDRVRLYTVRHWRAAVVRDGSSWRDGVIIIGPTRAEQSRQ